MKPILCLFLFLAFLVSANAQQLNGRIIDEQGNPIPNSTVYIYEVRRGIVANDLGQFQVSLFPGNYTCEFRSLGYNTEKQTITITNEEVSLSVTLKSTSYLLNEVVVYPYNEDPAYKIMRKAIAYAPYYRYQIKSYTSQAYIKGSLKIDKIPGILKRMAKINDSDFNIASMVGKTYVLESNSQIRYTSPEKYHQRVMAIKSTIPKEFNLSNGLGIITSNIYSPQMDERISPLSAGAFQYYNFKLEDVSYQSDFIVNRIRVIPRKKSTKLFSGHLYILENTWNVYMADLSASEMGTVIRYRINYHPVKPDVFLPTTYDLSLQINTMGIKGRGKYFASIRYDSLNVTPRQPELITEKHLTKEAPDNKASVKQQKLMDEIEKLSQKENLTTRDANRLSRMMTQVVEPQEVKAQRESLEIKDIEQVKIERDSLVFKHDSTYWAGIRVVPLQENEWLSYRINDSLSISSDTAQISERVNQLVIQNTPQSPLGKILQGSTLKRGKITFKYDGLSDALREYNFTDGFWLGTRIGLNYSFDKNNTFTLVPSVYYTTARNRVLWHVRGSLSYLPASLGYFSVDFGHISRDINGVSGESRLYNSLTSLLSGKNFIRFYDSRFVNFHNRIDVANGFTLSTNFEIDHRNQLVNRTAFNVLKKEVTENIFSSPTDYPQHTATKLSVTITYTPFLRYRMNNGKKKYDTSKYPTFHFNYVGGLGLFKSDYPAPIFHRLGFAIRQELKTSYFSKLNYQAITGFFVSKKQLYLNDFKYFTMQSMLFSAKSFDHTFQLLAPYSNTQKWWLETHINYQSDYLLLKNIPLLEQYLFNETVHLHTLSTDNMPFYLEAGYSIGLPVLSRVGVFGNFHEKRLKEFGFKISYPLLNLLEKSF